MTKQQKQDISSPPVDDKDAERIEEYDQGGVHDDEAGKKDS